MPVFNERNLIEEILRRVQAVDIPKELILVDDFSTDGTREWLQEVHRLTVAGQRDLVAQDGASRLRIDNLRFYFHEKNQGKCAALSTGFRAAAGDIVIVQDADLEYDPQEFHLLLQPIVDGKADVVYGSRYLGGTRRVDRFWHYVINSFLTFLSNALSNLHLTDMETCYKCFRREVLQGLQLRSHRFGFEPEITAYLARANWRVYEVPVSYESRTSKEGKKINAWDGVKAVWYILRFNLFP